MTAKEFTDGCDPLMTRLMDKINGLDSQGSNREECQKAELLYCWDQLNHALNSLTDDDCEWYRYPISDF